MLPSQYRMRRSEDFSAALRSGKRSGNDLVVVHAILGPHDRDNEAGPKVGFIVSKRVGNSVARHATLRKLRHILARMIPEISARALVVRAQPAAAHASSQELENAIRRAWRRLHA